jgi:glucose dehydrogenase
MHRVKKTILVLPVFSFPLATTGANSQGAIEWPYYGYASGRARYASQTRIDTSNVARLKRAWSYEMRSAGVPEARSKTS